MKKYEVLNIELLLVQAEDVITTSPGFVGGDHEFVNPNTPSDDGQFSE
ncbi:MAG: hypothetical protein IJ308_00665 [Clostridia bacterium]|nr:hypothetical protein [Clostridia bacterium]